MRARRSSVVDLKMAGDSVPSTPVRIPGTLAPFNGRYIVRGGNPQVVEGDPPSQRIVVIAFDSVAKAKAWEDSPAYEAIKPIRHSAAKSRICIVEGLAPQ